VARLLPLRKDIDVGSLPPTEVSTYEAHPDDPDLLRWDAELSKRHRPLDHAFWIREEQAQALWFKLGDTTVGYAYVRPGARQLWYPAAITIGPIGAHTAEQAEQCVVAAVHRALSLGDAVRIDTPGPHPALHTLLQAGFQIVDMDMFMAGAKVPRIDGLCYVGSGGTLF